MEDNNIDELLKILTANIDVVDTEEDNIKINYLCESLKNIRTELLNLTKLEELKKIEIDLEIKYEKFYEIGNYFDPLYIEIKNEIQKNKVIEMREKNRKEKLK